MKTQGQKIYLTDFTVKHCKLSYEWIKDPETNKFLAVTPPKTLKDQLKWFRESSKSKSDKIFAIHDQETDTYIGNCGIHQLSEENQNCFIGIMIGNKNYWDKGYGTDVIKTLLKYCFTKLKMHKVMLTVFTDNIRAQKCYRKAGFKTLTTFKEQILKDGKRIDEYVMEIFAKDWEE